MERIWRQTVLYQPIRLNSVPFNRTNDGAQTPFYETNRRSSVFDPEYYTAINSFDLPYDFYRPDSIKPASSLECNGMVELSQVSSIVDAISGKGVVTNALLPLRNGKRRNATYSSWTTMQSFKHRRTTDVPFLIR